MSAYKYCRSATRNGGIHSFYEGCNDGCCALSQNQTRRDNNHEGGVSHRGEPHPKLLCKATNNSWNRPLSLQSVSQYNKDHKRAHASEGF